MYFKISCYLTRGGLNHFHETVRYLVYTSHDDILIIKLLWSGTKNIEIAERFLPDWELLQDYYEYEYFLMDLHCQLLQDDLTFESISLFIWSQTPPSNLTITFNDSVLFIQITNKMMIGYSAQIIKHFLTKFHITLHKRR